MSGIVLPNEVRSRESRGIVVAVGEIAELTVGEVVVYAENGSSPYSFPTWVTLDTGEDGHAEDLVVVELTDVLLVLDEVPVPV